MDKTLSSPPPPKPGRDLLQYRPVRWFVGSWIYPSAFQWVFGAAFVLILLYAFFGTIRGSQNLATVVIWSLWWPLLPIFLFLFARAWCAVCPLAWAGGLVQRVPYSIRGPAPAFLRKYGIWLMALSFILLTWADRVWSFTSVPRATGTIFLVLLAGALITSFLYQRMVWCRYFCPIGALTGLYAMAAPLELRAQSSVCRTCTTKDCYRGNLRVEGCPLLEFPSVMDSNRNCSLCTKCIRACPKDVIKLQLRPPLAEIWKISKTVLGESFLSVTLVAVVFVQTIDMTTVWSRFMRWVVEGTPIKDYNLAFTVSFLGVLAAVLALFLMAVLASAKLGSARWQGNFAAYGYAYLPLALAGHLGHNLAHIFTESPRAIQVAINQLGLPFQLIYLSLEDPQGMTSAGPLAISIVALGFLASLFVAWEVGMTRGKGSRSALPHLALILFLGFIFLQMFFLPMNPRHGH